MSDTANPFAPLGAPPARAAAPADAGDGWRCALPIPPDAPPPPKKHADLGEPSARWVYRDASGADLFQVVRFDRGSGKDIRPLSYWLPNQGGRGRWRWVSVPAPRPLYGLDRLAARPSAPVVLCEGEKAADAAGRLAPDHVAMTSPAGSKSAGQADWSRLAGRAVAIWADADAPGLAYARSVAELLLAVGTASVAIVPPPAGVSAGWDAADAEAEGWTVDRVAALLATAAPYAVPTLDDADEASGDDASAAPKPKRGRGRPPTRERQRDQLGRLLEPVTLWHSPSGEGFARVPVGDHRENHAIRGSGFKRWLAQASYVSTGAVPSGQSLDDICRLAEARAIAEGPCRSPWLRVGSDMGADYIDLGGSDWRAIRITAEGWEVIAGDDLWFTRSGSMRALPMPEGGEGIDRLRRFLNTDAEPDFVLVASFLVAALRDRGPYPVLILAGEQGTGKSTFSRLVRALIDPNEAPIRAAPRDDRDLLVAAVNSHVIALDNLSRVEPWLADALCRLSTGGGFAARALHTDRDEMILNAQRPIILNGIPMLGDRPDLADRALTVRLRPMAETERRAEEEFWADFRREAPRLMGALCDALVCARRRLPDVRLDRLPRMADFAKLITAAEPALGWAPGTFAAAYTDNRADTTDAAFEADPIAVEIRALIRAEHRQGWTGTATELLALLNFRVSDSVRRSRLWPMTAQSLGNRIDRVAPLLRAKGYLVERRHSGARTISIVPIEGGPADPDFAPAEVSP